MFGPLVRSHVIVCVHFFLIATNVNTSSLNPPKIIPRELFLHALGRVEGEVFQSGFLLLLFLGCGVYRGDFLGEI